MILKSRFCELKVYLRAENLASYYLFTYLLITTIPYMHLHAKVFYVYFALTKNQKIQKVFIHASFF